MKKVALITGAGSGIGRATALALVQAGYAVVLAGRRQNALQETIALASADQSAMRATATDVTDPSSVEALFNSIRRDYGRLDFLFNNAGTNVPAVPLEELTIEDWRRVIDVNLTGAFLCAQQAIRLMKTQTPRGGRIINNGSVSAQMPRPHAAVYTASKHGLTGLTKSIALEGRAFDIACGQIDIGNAETEMATRQKTGVLQANGSVAIEPMMNVDAVVRGVLYMSSLPLDANVLFLTVMASKMPLVGRG